MWKKRTLFRSTRSAELFGVTELGDGGLYCVFLELVLQLSAATALNRLLAAFESAWDVL
jgi:hypothetical protein